MIFILLDGSALSQGTMDELVVVIQIWDICHQMSIKVYS